MTDISASAAKMDRIYRYQRHFYDATRKFFLIGRDALLEQMDVNAGDRILEIGCGTGRNLLRLSQLHPHAKLYGLDASNKMLQTSGSKFDANDLHKAVILRQGLAEELDAEKTFGINEKFDAVFFSYTLSMIPDWQAAIDSALSNLKPKGTLYVLDFGDGRDLPSWFYGMLTAWLNLFDVKPPVGAVDYLQSLSQQGKGLLKSFTVWRNYAFIAEFRRF